MHKQCTGLTSNQFKKEEQAVKAGKGSYICPNCVPGEVMEPPLDEDADSKTMLKKILSRVQANSAQMKDSVAKIVSLTESIEFMSKEFEDLKRRIVGHENRIKELEAVSSSSSIKIDSLSTAMASLTNHSRINNIEVSNVKQYVGEDIVSMMIRLGEVMGVEVKRDDIDKAHRVNSTNKNKPKPIIVRFISNLKKNQLLDSIRIKTKGGLSLTGESLGVQSSQEIFVNHHQTVVMKRLHYYVRKLRPDHVKKTGCYEDGVIWVQLVNSDASFYVRSLKDLEQLYAKCKVQLHFEDVA